jgi:hypothetical protein
LKRPLTQTISIEINKAGFVVKINFFYDGIAISDHFESAYGGIGCGRIFERQVFQKVKVKKYIAWT